MLFALVGGAVADMYDRRKVMLAAQAGVAALSALLALLSFEGPGDAALLLGLTFALGIGTAFYNPAAQASIGATVPRPELAGAASLNILGFNVARTLGPAIGGGIVALGGPFAAFAANALACLAAAATLAFWRLPDEAAARPDRTGIHRAMAEGLRCVRDLPALRAIVARALRLHPRRQRDLGADAFGGARPHRRRAGDVRPAARRARASAP